MVVGCGGDGCDVVIGGRYQSEKNEKGGSNTIASIRDESEN